jgi:hypothetical protein
VWCFSFSGATGRSPVLVALAEVAAVGVISHYHSSWALSPRIFELQLETGSRAFVDIWTHTALACGLSLWFYLYLLYDAAHVTHIDTATPAAHNAHNAHRPPYLALPWKTTSTWPLSASAQPSSAPKQLISTGAPFALSLPHRHQYSVLEHLQRLPSCFAVTSHLHLHELCSVNEGTAFDIAPSRNKGL